MAQGGWASLTRKYNVGKNSGTDLPWPCLVSRLRVVARVMLGRKFAYLRDLDLLHADRTVVKMPLDTAKVIIGLANMELLPERGVGVRRFRRTCRSRLEFLPAPAVALECRDLCESSRSSRRPV